MSVTAASHRLRGVATRWAVEPLHALAADEPNAITDGPFGSKLKSQHYTPEGPRVIRLQNIGDSVFKDAHAHISHDHFRTLLKHRIYSGDLVIAALGENPPRSCIIPDCVGDAIVKADCIRFRPSGRILPSFLNYVLNSPPLKLFAKQIIHGVGRPRLNLGEIKSLPIPVPPFEEQRLIVSEIERQFTRLDAGVAGLERVRANLKRYRAAVLKAACEGTLVPTEADLARAEGRDYETGDQLLERILTTRRENWTGKGKYKQPAISQAEHVRTIPLGWAVASIDQLTDVITSGSRDWSKYYGKGSGTFIMAQNVRMGRLDLTERQVVGPPADNRDRIRSQVQPNDLLVTIVGANTGDVCRVPSELPEHYVCQSVALMRPVEGAISRFCEIYLTSDEHGQSSFAEYIYGQGRPHLGFDELRTTPVVLPPLAEQHRIVAEVERRLSIIDGLEALVETNLARAGRLRQSILAKAFSGELVPEEAC